VITLQSSLGYSIQIAHGLLSDPATLLPLLAPYGKRFAVICDHNVAPLYGQPLADSVRSAGWQAALFSFPAGEKHKTRETKQDLENRFLQEKLGSDLCVLAIGGGVTTDLAGYVAATYCRGVPLILLPTTLMAMVDASLGGKNGVNVPQGKNLIGTRYPPKQVLIDPATLQTLREQELKEGIVEMIKHGLIANPAYFDFLETYASNILAREENMVTTAIVESCRIKEKIVAEETLEMGKRHLLNLGHTIGHALEHITGYALSHGEAVALGLLVEGQMAQLLGHLEVDALRRIRALIAKYSLPLQLPRPVDFSAIFASMLYDKKTVSGQPRFVMLGSIGSCLPCSGNYCMPVEEALVAKAFDALHGN
jgi:3-dehydroquinate synthase